MLGTSTSPDYHRRGDIGWGLFPGACGRSTIRSCSLLTRLGLAPRSAGSIRQAANQRDVDDAQRARAGSDTLDGGAPLGAALGALIIAGLIAPI